MPLKTHQDDMPSINLTPMIDIVFQLIIFFMVGSRFTPPITFETVPVTFDDDGGDVLEQFISAEYDFFYTNPK